ncbi:MAG: hypothetical protein AMJ60_04305 [Desulfobacterales bacterium SG8_35]|nr:MAG: hypothetical protein AMJ60_04305 [Desulfobacterales bacterium SG8_35]
MPPFFVGKTFNEKMPINPGIIYFSNQQDNSSSSSIRSFCSGRNSSVPAGNMGREMLSCRLMKAGLLTFKFSQGKDVVFFRPELILASDIRQINDKRHFNDLTTQFFYKGSGCHGGASCG